MKSLTTAAEEDEEDDDEELMGRRIIFPPSFHENPDTVGRACGKAH